MEKKDILYKVGKYTVTKEDDMNFGLYLNRPKQLNKKNTEAGNIDKLIGYYGYFYMVISKIVNIEALEGFKVSKDADVAKEILNALSELETSLRDEFSKRPREY